MSADEKKTVRIEDENDRWRFTCPRGHRDWEPTNHHFWCVTCARAEGVDGVFHELRDKTNGEHYARDEVQLLTPVGPYDRDLDRRGSA
jgi:Fe2+ or Zn2+ uptake regulation protein